MKKPTLQVSIHPFLLALVQDIKKREIRKSDSAMAELLIFEALVARKEIDPNVTL